MPISNFPYLYYVFLYSFWLFKDTIQYTILYENLIQFNYIFQSTKH